MLPRLPRYHRIVRVECVAAHLLEEKPQRLAKRFAVGHVQLVEQALAAFKAQKLSLPVVVGDDILAGDVFADLPLRAFGGLAEAVGRVLGEVGLEFELVEMILNVRAPVVVHPFYRHGVLLLHGKVGRQRRQETLQLGRLRMDHGFGVHLGGVDHFLAASVATRQPNLLATRQCRCAQAEQCQPRDKPKS